MTTLRIKDFSCVDEAELHLSQLTILIGPQATGKSVITKLVYFFYDILDRQFRALEDEEDLESFRMTLSADFKKWFPPSAWGGKKFEISFTAGAFFVKVTRVGGRKKSMDTESVRVVFSPWFERQYAATLKSYQERRSARSNRNRSPAILDDFWRVREAATKALEQELGKEYVGWQLFVPAGRSFFTSVGKAIAAFEYSGMLDPLTVKFGRFFAAIRDHRRGRFARARPPDEATQRNRNEMMKKLFGGNITFKSEQEYVESDDGRKIPFASLSSGQQELLPLWLSLEYSQEAGEKNIVYIEEPEAHLFPTAQSQIVEFLASVISESETKMVVTTHSPYVLSQINILLKATALAQDKPEQLARIAAVVNPRSWLRRSSTVAYAIVGRRLRRITDEEGLLDGDYLDEVSGHLAREFSQLVEIELSDDK
ncbi:AAA family ATPase [Bradyrhizobium sp. MOS003]|uniref:AAA family ATPase n=1 Tax=Bradyrhizobium sp. MOS003 TaxID=2133946 RepID=UPI000D1319CE|nr:AAA family ATPase [Bradyrhizobium sp. MOS003]PSO19506.1 hypothetical protein C7G42_14730 [Bradyrhizobium sp. MOS003]